MWSFVLCAPYRILLGWSNHGRWDGLNVWNSWGEYKSVTGFGWENMKGKKPLSRPWLRWEDNIKTCLTWISVNWTNMTQDWDVWEYVLGMVMNVLKCHKMLGISWPTEEILPFQEGLFYDFRSVHFIVRTVCGLFFINSNQRWNNWCLDAFVLGAFRFSGRCILKISGLWRPDAVHHVRQVKKPRENLLLYLLPLNFNGHYTSSI